jgi:hypothetical protein
MIDSRNLTISEGVFSTESSGQSGDSVLSLQKSQSQFRMKIKIQILDDSQIGRVGAGTANNSNDFFQGL